MIFGLFGKKGRQEEPEDEEEIDPVRFLGAMNGKDANLAANQRLADLGLVPAKDLMTDGLSRRAELIRIDPKGPVGVVNFAVDGIIYPGPKLPKAEALAITQMLKLLAGLDIKERKASQSGGIKCEFDGKAFQLMITSVGVADGERLIVKVVDPNVKLEMPQEIGMSEDLRKKVRAVLSSRKGVFFVVGPPSSGTSTTLYAVLRGVDTYMLSVFTLGDTGGRKLHNITPFDAIMGDNLATTLQRIARVEGHLVLTEPVKGPDQIKQLWEKQDQIGLITEFAAKDAVHGVVQIMDWLGDPNAAAEGLTGVLSQKLIRMLCADCKQAYRPNPEFLKKAGLPAGITNLYRKPATDELPDDAPVCEKCGGVGFYGRTAMFEFIEMTDGMKQVIKEKGDANLIRTQMKRDKMLTLQQDALRLVAEGKTSLDEVQRVFRAPDK